MSVTTAVRVRTRNSTPAPHQLTIACTQHPGGWMRKGDDWVMPCADLEPFALFTLSSFCHADIVFLISRLIFLLVAYSYTNVSISTHDQAQTVYHPAPLSLPELKHSSQQQPVDLGQANRASPHKPVPVRPPANCKHNSAALKPAVFSL